MHRIIETYKDHDIMDIDGIIYVNQFMIALDDSKINGNREFVNSANNVETAKKYIDWITR